MLDDEKHERFCQALAWGRTLREASAYAGLTYSGTKSPALRDRYKARIKEIKATGTVPDDLKSLRSQLTEIKRGPLTAEFLKGRAQDVLEFAMKDDDLRVAMAAIQFLYSTLTPEEQGEGKPTPDRVRVTFGIVKNQGSNNNETG